MQSRLQMHHETLNGWLKTWGIPSKVFCHSILHHGNVFCACTVVTQLTIENGEPLFEVKYSEDLIISLLVSILGHYSDFTLPYHRAR